MRRRVFPRAFAAAFGWPSRVRPASFAAMSGSPFALSSVVARLRWKAILLGFAVDYGGSVTFGFVSGLAMSFWHASQGGQPAEILEAVFATTPYMLLLLVVGSLFVVVGGLLTGWLAPRDRLLNVGAFALLNLLLGFTYYHELPGWYFAASMAVIVPCALLGAWLASLLFPRREVPPPPLPPTV